MPPLTLFLNEDTKKLLHNKFVVILGDSIQRGIYKDLVALLQGNEYLSSADLKAKGETNFMNDVRLEGGKMHNGINYREVRQYRTDYHLVRFYFITRIHNKYWEEIIFPDLQGEPIPDVVIMNSCLWDVSRYGQQNAMKTFKKNIETTFSKLNSILPMESLIIWNTALPVAKEIKGGFLLPELQDLDKVLRLDVLRGNFYAKELAKLYEIDVLDLNYYFRQQMHRQVGDGVHWNYMAHRRITNLILAHIAVSWGVGCPRGEEEEDSKFEDFCSDVEVEDINKGALQNSLDEIERKKKLPICAKEEEKDNKLSTSKDNPKSRLDIKEEPARPSSADRIQELKNHGNEPKRSSSAPTVGNDFEAKRSRSPIELVRPPGLTCAVEDSGATSHKERSPIHQNTPSLTGGGLPKSLDLKPINLGNIQKGSPPSLIRSPGRSARGAMPRAGGRYLPYDYHRNIHHYQPPVQPRTCWYPNRAPIAPHPTYLQGNYMSNVPYPYTGNAYNPYNRMLDLQAQHNMRMRQRLAAERNMEVVRGLLMGDVYNLQ